jgi:polyhydroxyalkanoate synthesis regulator phasin
MSNILKDMAALLFSMGEELERKAEEYKNTREARQEEFEQKIRQQKQDLKEKYQGDMESMKEKLSETAGKIGLATKEEIEELKTLMKDLSEKIDNMNK